MPYSVKISRSAFSIWLLFGNISSLLLWLYWKRFVAATFMLHASGVAMLGGIGCHSGSRFSFMELCGENSVMGLLYLILSTHIFETGGAEAQIIAHLLERSQMLIRNNIGRRLEYYLTSSFKKSELSSDFPLK